MDSRSDACVQYAFGWPTAKYQRIYARVFGKFFIDIANLAGANISRAIEPPYHSRSVRRSTGQNVFCGIGTNSQLMHFFVMKA